MSNSFSYISMYITMLITEVTIKAISASKAPAILGLLNNLYCLQGAVTKEEASRKGRLA